MVLKRVLLLLIAGIGATNLGISACAEQRNQQVEVESPTVPAQATPTQVQETQPSAVSQASEREPDVPYVPTPERVVDAMLRLANVNKNDRLYDLGSGDGRIVITAAKQYGLKGVGIDIDPERIREANKNAQQAGVSDRVEFRQQDLFKTDLSDATVVTLYLLPSVNLQLRPKLLRELKPGTRIVSHAFNMGDWKPEKVVQVDGATVYYWTVPEDVPPELLKSVPANSPKSE